eukprot:6187686-Pleurochrysis_carterae.AAC.1
MRHRNTRTLVSGHQGVWKGRFEWPREPCQHCLHTTAHICHISKESTLAVLPPAARARLRKAVRASIARVSVA